MSARSTQAQVLFKRDKDEELAAGQCREVRFFHRASFGEKSEDLAGAGGGGRGRARKLLRYRQEFSEAPSFWEEDNPFNEGQGERTCYGSSQGIHLVPGPNLITTVSFLADGTNVTYSMVVYRLLPPEYRHLHGLQVLYNTDTLDRNGIVTGTSHHVLGTRPGFNHKATNYTVRAPFDAEEIYFALSPRGWSAPGTDEDMMPEIRINGEQIDPTASRPHMCDHPKQRKRSVCAYRYFFSRKVRRRGSLPASRSGLRPLSRAAAASAAETDLSPLSSPTPPQFRIPKYDKDAPDPYKWFHIEVIPAALHSRVSYYFRVMRGSKQSAKGECGLSAFQLQAIPSELRSNVVQIAEQNTLIQPLPLQKVYESVEEYGFTLPAGSTKVGFAVKPVPGARKVWVGTQAFNYRPEIDHQMEFPYQERSTTIVRVSCRNEQYKAYKFHVTTIPLPELDVRLKLLRVTGFGFTHRLDVDENEHRLDVASSTTHVVVKATRSYTRASVAFDWNDRAAKRERELVRNVGVPSQIQFMADKTGKFESTSRPVYLDFGMNEVYVTVHSEGFPEGVETVVTANGVKKRKHKKIKARPNKYVLQIFRPFPTEILTLEDIHLSPGALKPAFDPNVTEYGLALPMDLQRMEFEVLPKKHCQVASRLEQGPCSTEIRN